MSAKWSNLVGQVEMASPLPNTDGDDGLTKKELAASSNLKAVDAHARTEIQP